MFVNLWQPSRSKWQHWSLWFLGTSRLGELIGIFVTPIRSPLNRLQSEKTLHSTLSKKQVLQKIIAIDRDFLASLSSASGWPSNEIIKRLEDVSKWNEWIKCFDLLKIIWTDTAAFICPSVRPFIVVMVIFDHLNALLRRIYFSFKTFFFIHTHL